MKSNVQSNTGLEVVLQLVFYYENHSGITVRDVSSLTGKHERQVYHYISGERKPDLAFLRQLSRYMIETYSDDRIASYFLPSGYRVIRHEESDRTKLSKVLQVLEGAITNILHILLMDDERAKVLEIDALIRNLGEIFRPCPTDPANESLNVDSHHRRES
jgi:hypothetical protein